MFPKKEEDESEKEINLCMMYNVCRFTELTELTEKLVFITTKKSKIAIGIQQCCKM